MTDDAPLQREPGESQQQSPTLDTAPRDGTYIEVTTRFAIIKNVYWCDEASDWAEGGTTFTPRLPSFATWKLMEEPPGEPVPKAEASDRESVRWAVARGKLLAAIAGADGDAGTVLRLIEDHESAIRREATSAERERCVQVLRDRAAELKRHGADEWHAEYLYLLKNADYLAANKPDIIPAVDPVGEEVANLLYDLSYSPATAHEDATWSVFGAGFGLRCFPTKEKALEEAAAYFGIAHFTLRVWPNRTQVHVTAAPEADPETILRQAISALEAELTALDGCPVHHAKSNKYHPLSIEDIADERWRDPSTADPVALLLSEVERLLAIPRPYPLLKTPNSWNDHLERQRLARSYQDAAKLLGESGNG